MSRSDGSCGQMAGARLSKVEQENLWQLFKPTVLDLLRVAAGHSANRPIEEGEDAVQEVFLSFAQQAARGRLDCLDNRKLSEISPAELSQHIPRCRRYLLLRWCGTATRPIGKTIILREFTSVRLATSATSGKGNQRRPLGQTANVERVI